MINKKLRWCDQHGMKTSRCPLTHPFSLVPLQRPMHELHGHLLILSQPGQDELKEPAGKQTYFQDPLSFLFCLQLCLCYQSCVIVISSETNSWVENVMCRGAFLHGVLGHSVFEGGQLLNVLIVEPLHFEV